MVFVPDPPRTDAMFGATGGFPRQVPSDAFAAALSFLPWSQQLILLAVFVLAAAGVGRLVPGGTPAGLAAVVFYLWNPYVAERLLLGHWALLLGYAGLPWVLDAVLRRRPLALAAALVPAAAGGFAAMNVTALVLFGGLVAVRGRGALRAVLVFTAMALPWLVPALLNASGTRTDPLGVDLFAARADTPFGTFGSLLSLGGIWNAETVPSGYSLFLPSLLRLLLCLAALAALLAHRSAPPARAALASGALGLGLASIGITAPGRALLRTLVDLWPAFGVLRDAHLYIAPLALALALGLSHLAVRPEGPRDGREAGTPVPGRTRRAAAALGREMRGWRGAWVALVPVMVLPTLAWGAFGRLDSVEYPREWLAAQRMIDSDPVGGKVLSLPWGAYRRPAWNEGRAVLDPWPRMTGRRVVWNDGLRVGNRELAQEDPETVETDRLLRGGGDLASALADAGFRYVVISRDLSEKSWTNRLTKAEVALQGPTLLVYLLDHSG
ncbi:hypothetical protein [Actinocorallia populi]|uniref:hypothetical protein n=1 Tax=Actinocorallia populi TaxID=2079200 RepID=UPI0018E56FA8|nr:hypothetical protein [Actinocorallia populi]